MNKIILEDVDNICQENLPWDDLRNSTILITGAYGYIAAYIIYVLLELNRTKSMNIHIVALCRNYEYYKRRFDEFIDRGEVTILIQDVCESIDYKNQVDYIIHAASPANPYINYMQPIGVLDANVRGFRNLLMNAVKWKTKGILLFSSGTVYGNETPIGGVNEEYRGIIDFDDLGDCYRLAKQTCEMMAKAYNRQYPDVEIKIVRPFIVYGPGQGVSQKKMTTDFVKNYILNENIIVKSNGEGVRSYIYIKDAIKGFFYVWLKGEKNESYNICSMKGICTINQLAEVFCGYNPQLKVVHEMDSSNYLKSKAVCFVGKNDKLQSLGWKDETGINEGIWRMISWAMESDFLQM